MAVKLQKGGNVSLSKADPGLTSLLIGLGWNPRATAGTEATVHEIPLAASTTPPPGVGFR